MSSDQNKTEKPTPFKLSDAKKRGQVSKSIELGNMASFVFFIGLCLLYFSQLQTVFSSEIKRLIILSTNFLMSINNVVVLFSEVMQTVIETFFPIALLLIIVGVASNLGQTGFIFTSHPLKPDFTRLNPASGVKRLFAKKTMFELFKNSLKLVVTFIAIWFTYPIFVDESLLLMQRSETQISDVWFSLFIKMALFAVALAAPFTLLDVLFSRWDFLQKMMMSTKEVKDEHKKREGDPQVRAKQKQIQKELLQKSAALNSVKDADVIIVNPTHIALALQYKKEEMLAPKVIALGKGELAHKIRQQGRRYGVPIIQNKALARKLYKEVHLGGYVPVGSFNELAPIFRWLLGMDQKGII